MVILEKNPKKAIESLLSEGFFELFEDIPVFTCHERVESTVDGKEVTEYVIEKSDLKGICENSNDLLGGYFPTITEGHRNFLPGAKESDQPQVLGFAGNFKARGDYIFSDHYVIRSLLRNYQRHPFRSAEYVHEQRTILGVAVLTKPPYLGVGTSVCCYQFQNGKIARPKRKRASGTVCSVFKSK
jgi:hypothetical protein